MPKHAKKPEAQLLLSKVEENDRLRFVVADNAVTTAETTLRALRAEFEATTNRRIVAQARRRRLADELAQKYGIGPNDTFDTETGIITRPKKEDAPPAPAKGTP